MKILITGPDGFVGSAVCSELLDDGLSVRGAYWKAMESPVKRESLSVNGEAPSVNGGSLNVNSGGDRSFATTEPIVVGDINASTDWSRALVEIDAVVHLAARVHIMDDTAEDPLAAFREVNVEGTRRLAESAAKAGVKRFVFISSIKVNGEATDFLATKRHKKAREENLNNDHLSTIIPQSFSERDKPAPEDAYGQSKHEAEQVLREIDAETGMEVVILRPPLLYGPGVKANFLKLIEIVDKGIPLPLGGICNKRSLLGLSNFADLISKCVTDPRAAGQTFAVCDGEDVSSAELVRRIAKALGKKPRLLPVPEGLMKLAGRLTGKSAQVQRLCSSLQIDSSHVRKTLDWTPPLTMEEELSRTAKFFRGQKTEI